MRFGNGRAQALLILWLGLVSFSHTACAQHSEQARFEQSRQHEQKALELRKKKDFRGALEEQKKAVELNPKDAKPLTILAGIYDEINLTENAPENLPKAKETLEKAIRFDPNDALAHDMLAGVLSRLNQKQQAIEVQMKAAQLEPNNLQYLTKVGVFRDEANDNTAAQKTCEQVLQKNSEYIYALLIYGMLKIDVGRYDQAIQLFERALTATPTESQDEYYQNFVRQKLKEVKEKQSTKSP